MLETSGFMPIFFAYRLKKNENGEIEVDDFLAFIDRKRFQGAFLQPMNLDVSVKRLPLFDFEQYVIFILMDIKQL